MAYRAPRGSVSPAARVAFTPDDEERIERRLAALCETSLYAFVRRAWPIIEPGTPFRDNWHVHVICEQLEAISHGQRARLVINIPPRHMKSILVSVMWPCWEWITQPHRRWFFASYSDRLATRHSLDRRAIIESEWYQKHWGDRVRLLSNLKTEFMNESRGQMFATSVRGTITGMGGTRLVCDDPLDPTRAASDPEREGAVHWFRNTFINRLDTDEDSAIVLVMQRLHEDDPAGIATRELGYDLLKIEAICNPPEGQDAVTYSTRAKTYIRKRGNVLWPERFNREYLEGQRLALGENGFSGQYQQEPHAKGGTLFQVNKLVRLSLDEYARLRPRVVARCRAWDAAGTPGAGDWTAGVLLSRLDDGRIMIEHVHRMQWHSADVDALIRQTAEADGRNTYIREEQEPGSSGLAIVQARQRAMPGYLYLGVRSTGEKILRWQPFSVAVNNGNVLLAPGGWQREFVDELEKLPRSSRDDQADAASLAYNQLTLAIQQGLVVVPLVARG